MSTGSAPYRNEHELLSASITLLQWLSDVAQSDTGRDDDHTCPRATGGSPTRRAVGRVELGPVACRDLITRTPTLQRENDTEDRDRRTKLVRDQDAQDRSGRPSVDSNRVDADHKER